MDIGVLGGTYDPIHNGHLAMAEAARARLGLVEVRFVLAGQPWLRPEPPVAPVEHRVEMVRLAIVGRLYFKLSTMEVVRVGPSYSVDTITELKRERQEDELFFIIGSDSLAELSRWKEPARLVSLCRMAVIPRPGYPIPDLGVLEASIPGITQRVVLFDRPLIDISATVIRRRAALGLSLGGLVPEAVESYIRKHKLYFKF